jgi:sensor histidine kinase YesM
MRIARKRYFVDRKVQGALLVRTFFYWLFCFAAITIMLLIWRSLAAAEPFWMQLDEVWFRHAPIAIVSVLLLPLVLVDVVRTSNRFAGPMYRMRKHMRAIMNGQQVGPLKFREHDYLIEFADEFNAMLKFIREHPQVEDAHASSDDSSSAAVSA